MNTNEPQNPQDQTPNQHPDIMPDETDQAAVPEPESVTEVTDPDAAPKPAPRLRYPTMADFEGMSEVEIDIALGVYARMHQAREDEKIRQDPYIRLYMTELIHELKYLIQDFAGELNIRRAKDTSEKPNYAGGWYASDETGELLLWQLMEFLNRAVLPRDDECYQASVRYLQLDYDHAAAHFETNEKDGVITLQSDWNDGEVGVYPRLRR